ncbi:uncharacterized protein LOC113471021 [Diaphorina citri]|uniref:Uncharacterized protein LOC113471021 n=1 Tax=Diaphorina citri TaxID=121845 RepID=A0A3Q0JB49_DIACI|nr:uncharacterized protein LOC113471021 [Diaphorina citri]
MSNRAIAAELGFNESTIRRGLKKAPSGHLGRYRSVLSTEQDLEIVEHCKALSSHEEFISWKEKEEVKSFSYFSQHRAQNGCRKYYYCQHDGHSKPHRKSNEPARLSSRKKKIGQIKKDFQCIARIIVKIEHSKLLVEYHSTHNHRLTKNDIVHQPQTPSTTSQSLLVEYHSTHNHRLTKNDIVHQPQTPSTTSHIQKQIALNVPSINIHRSLQSMELERENRTKEFCGDRNLIITEKSIKLQIAKVKKQTQFHKDDATSVYYQVNQLKQVIIV